ncbi:unnamed protein product [Spirodela intermedia]|uniref:Uncharacterized protein n=1 Tax=Spirodela intermedia TaxID=51605 RepID=A0A7I8J371_SPIIN|nr:unnamed protein product [Spirodela intermedia]CAA6664558.1 unnamed protein product [Spirodela intermedia]
MCPLTPVDPPAPLLVGRYIRNKRLSKQLSMRETRREAIWEKRRKQILEQSTLEGEIGIDGKRIARGRSLTDEDLDDLRGSIELGFGFSEEAGSRNLCHMLPALDLYFAVNKQISDSRLLLSPSPVSTPSTAGGGSSSSLLESPSPRSPFYHAACSPSLKIFSPGDGPKQVKTKLRHWAQAVACAMMQQERIGTPGGPPAGRNDRPAGERGKASPRGINRITRKRCHEAGRKLFSVDGGKFLWGVEGERTRREGGMVIEIGVVGGRNEEWFRAYSRHSAWDNPPLCLSDAKNSPPPRSLSPSLFLPLESAPAKHRRRSLHAVQRGGWVSLPRHMANWLPGGSGDGEIIDG